MKSKFDTIIDDIHEEYRSACKAHPLWPEDIIHQVAIMQEEAGEATRASLNYVYENGSLEELRKELIQTGAMVVRCLINLKEKQVDLPNESA